VIQTLILRRALLTIAVVVVVTLLVVPPLVVWGALYTESGAQFIVRHLPRHLGPVTLEIDGFSGSVAYGLHVERVVVDHELVHLTFDDIDARVALAPLLLQSIRVLEGHVGHADVQVRRRQHPSTPGPPSFLPRWMLIRADDAQIGRADLEVYSGAHLEVRNLHGAAVIRHSVIRVFQAEGLLASAHVSAAGELRAADPLGMTVKGHLDWHPQGQAAWVLDGSARGDLNGLSIVARTASPFRADVTGQLLDLTSHLHWVATVALQDFELAAFGVGGPFGEISGQLAGSGDLDTFSAHGTLDPAGLHSGAFEVAFEGGWAQHTLTAHRMEARHVASGARASAAGTIAVVEHGPRLELKGAWSDFRWPLLGRDPPVRSAAGSFELSGIMPYRVHVAGELRAADLAPMPVDLTGTLDKNRFDAERAEADLYGGHASLAGSVIWSPAETWSVRGRATGMDPAKLRGDLPGSLSFDFSASGSGFSPRGNLTASFGALSGKLRGVAAGGGGTLTHAGKTWGFSNLRVSLGGTTLALDGHIDEVMNLRFALAAQDLSLLSPGSRGTLKASGTLGGTFAEPSVIGSAVAADIDYQGMQLHALDAEVDFEPGVRGKDSKIDVRLHQLVFRGRTLEAATFQLQGPPGDFRVRFNASAPGMDVSLAAHGPYAAESFKGQLTTLAVSVKDAGLHLGLDRPVDFLVSSEHLRLEWLCLVGTPGSMCADGEWTSASWSTTVMTDELPLATLTAGMTPKVQYLGTINALARLSGGAGTSVQGTLRSRLADAEIAHRLASRKVEHTRIGSGTVNVQLGPAVIAAQAELGDGQIGTMHASLTAQRTSAEWADMPISGELHAQSAECGLISLYVPDIDRASGHFNADVQVAGTLGAPRLSGLVKVSAGEIDVYQVNLTLRDIELEAHLGDEGIDFKGAARVGAGNLSAGGHLEWRGLQPYGKFHLQGSNLRVADIPEVQIDASPDLDFAVSGRRIDVTGKVLVPYAKIAPKDITNAVRTSADEVIVGTDVEDPNKRFEVTSAITLALGERVNVDTLGLTAKLGGSLTIRSGEDAITRGTGELTVDSGKYTAYGRQLDVDRGRLIFTGGPIDNPGIDLRAKKVFTDVTAYLNVRGTLLQPRMSFSSDPPLPQSQIAQLILAGGSMETTRNTGAGNVALGQGVALLAQQYGSILGIQDASYESDLNNETSVVFGRYLSPRLYISYGVSLTEQLNTLKMRYTLGDHWTLKAEFGQAQGGDLVYTIDK